MLKGRVRRPGTSGLGSNPHSVLARGPPRVPGDFAVVGIGASAGGLDACTKLVEELPADHGMALILVQHLDPTHESMMVDLLAGHTGMTVRQATDGMPLEPDHLYIIPPGTYLAVNNGALRVSQPEARHGARLPFDFLLHSLAEAFAERAVCVILSGTGSDGSLGLKAVKERRGFVIAQAPEEAAYDGMPRSAIMTGAVDLVLPAGQIPGALLEYQRTAFARDAGDSPMPRDEAPDSLSAIIDLLRRKTAHDFTLYKPGTMRRRIERRMAKAAIETDHMDRYLEILRSDTAELAVLAEDLLINVTSFFRDPKVFDFLAEKIIPKLVENQPSDRPVRIWIAGCSTGEETYSLAILFHERIVSANPSVKLQVFASDVDSNAVSIAREGLYPESIEADVSTARLARFFSREDRGYRVSPELRAMVVFTVQDVLADPPFSRIDLVSCRNLLIYLGPEAQAKVVGIFHFALREGGILLLGSSETVGNLDGRFEMISKSERLYRHAGGRGAGDFSFLTTAGSGRVPVRPGTAQRSSRQASLAEFCRQIVMETYAPAAVLINRKQECLYHLGPTDRYLRVAPGHPTHELMAMAHESARTKLRAAIQRACRENTRIIVAGGTTKHEGSLGSYSIAVQPVLHGDEELLLICFIDDARREPKGRRAVRPQDVSRVAELERELEATRTELQAAVRTLEISDQEQKVINEEALSVNEEYQSTNEELLTSKEELQALNEELTALNAQLQETLERQRTTSNDLKNVLYSTDVATLFLDPDLNIRFFTPATRSLFSVISSDVGRPLADLNFLTSDGALLDDARTVLETLAPIEREIEARSGAWYIRRILPYRAEDNGVEGVVITFADITERRRAADALEAARRQAELANIAKSRFLAAASHDLRQPLQTLVLLQELLEKSVDGKGAQSLVARLAPTLDAMSGMLNSLLDINQIEAGTVRAEMVCFAVGGLLERLRDEFQYHAQAQSLALRAVPCGLSIRSDPRLLEQMVRNLLSNALKYTKRGKVLLGCRRHKGTLSIEIWDTGAGIPDAELHAIFEEYHQLDNAARERSRGLGLGLAIVQRLANLLGHRVRVHSRPGMGSVFAIEVMLSPDGIAPSGEDHRPGSDGGTVEDSPHTGAILIVEDDPDVRDLLKLVLKKEGHRIEVAADGVAALGLLARGTIEPDLILADYNLPNGMDGIQVAAKVRQHIRRDIPVVILTGDISTDTLRDIARQDCVQLNKPVKLKEMIKVIRQLLPIPHFVPAGRAAQPAKAPTGLGLPSVIFVVDDDIQVCAAIRIVLEDDGWMVQTYSSCEAFLAAHQPGSGACLLIDAYLPGMSGLELLRRLHDAGHLVPTIMITGNSDVRMAVEAMKAGASDFIEKPIGGRELIVSVRRIVELFQDSNKVSAWQENAANQIARLTPRQRRIMELVLAGNPSKNIAADLGISQRTVENHRAAIMKKTGSKSLPALARLALTAASGAEDKTCV